MVRSNGESINEMEITIILFFSVVLFFFGVFKEQKEEIQENFKPERR